MDKDQKYNSFNTNTPSSESYRNYGNEALGSISGEKFLNYMSDY
jgi:hypothetical protein